MKKIITIASCLSLLLMGCNDSFLDKEPLDEVGVKLYFKTESDLRTYTRTFYPLFEGYGLDVATKMITDDEQSDDLAPSTANTVAAGIHLIPNSNTENVGVYWQWEDLRNVNYFLKRCGTAEVEPVILDRYRAEARFFRAYIYFPKLKAYGNVPWYETDLTIEDKDELYKGQDSRQVVVAKMLEDLDFAIKNLPEKGKEEAGRINKDVALAFKARVCLHDGTFRKYHGIDGATEILQQAFDAAKELEGADKYSIHNTGNPKYDYQNLFIQNDLAGNSEMIFFKNYVLDKLTHNMSPHISGGVSFTKSLVDTYLCADGKPIKLNSDYSDATLQEELTNRDPRLLQVCVYPGETYLQKNIGKPSIPGTTNNRIVTTGYQVQKYFVEDQVLMDFRNDTDAPIFRYAEILLIYAEAAAELGLCDQTLLDKTINKLRDRAGMPHLSENVGYEDPILLEQYPNVSNLLREIRRERRVELVCEGYRYDDLMRWKCGRLLEKPSLGMRFVQSQYPEVKARKYGETIDKFNITLDPNGYIDVYQAKYPKGFKFDETKHYYMPLPLDQLSINTNLKQSPNWNKAK